MPAARPGLNGSSVARKLVWVLGILPAGILLVALAVANRHAVRLVLDPLAPQDPALSLEAPLFLMLLAAVAAGVLLGGVATWLKQRKWRRAARQRGQEAESLRRETDRLNRQMEAAQPRLPEASAADG